MASNSPKSFQIPAARSDLPLGIVCGVAFSFGLFILMGIAPLVGDIKAPKDELQTRQIAMNPPEVEDIEIEPEPPEEEEPPPPEMEMTPPDISLDQLAIAINPGQGGGIGGDFSLPDVTSTVGQLSSDDLFNFSDLDEPPKLLDRSEFNFPLSLKMKPVKGQIVVYVELDERGSVTLARVANSNLPAFNEYVLREIRGRKFSAPTVQGKPVRAKANLPIPIVINKS
ncbi:energy transducer TonB [Cerasicoccus arenae]|uniref:TonB C-terminal domain-containing protein n=1 Tax=Cerasicoccus arenae TaxID=424488 RepID=A0A8J3DCA8_9BACT|nr:energy transducer TonB [Cerasicoccus arenae]MBK1858260.1 energy transducer TonB [Cerasicoccus arenae]GHC02235.1 hypothetical protein GCM10007047_18460 [Cerasicoccus arenae]